MLRKGFTLIEIMIVVAITATLAMVAVAMYQRYIERARNSAAQSLLQQLALAEAATIIEAETGGVPGGDFAFLATSADIPAVKRLSDFGFRPDPQVGFAVLPLKSGASGFVAFAAHRGTHSSMYIYDDVSFTGVRPYQPGSISVVDPPEKLPIFIMTGDLANPITSTETVKVDIGTGLVTSSGP